MGLISKVYNLNESATSKAGISSTLATPGSRDFLKFLTSLKMSLLVTLRVEEPLKPL